MYAVIKTGGKQQTVSEGDVIRVEKLSGDEGSSVEFKDVLMVGTDKEIKVGQPVLSNAVVVGEVLEQDKDKRVVANKLKMRKLLNQKNMLKKNLKKVRIKAIKT